MVKTWRGELAPGNYVGYRTAPRATRRPRPHAGSLSFSHRNIQSVVVRDVPDFRWVQISCVVYGARWPIVGSSSN